jgi:hypothetical protein
MMPMMSEVFKVNDFSVERLSSWAMTSKSIPHSHVTMVTKVSVVCSHTEMSSKKYLCPHMKWLLKLILRWLDNFVLQNYPYKFSSKLVCPF